MAWKVLGDLGSREQTLWTQILRVEGVLGGMGQEMAESYPLTASPHP